MTDWEQDTEDMPTLPEARAILAHPADHPTATLTRAAGVVALMSDDKQEHADALAWLDRLGNETAA
ncbi:hypothetical protein [Roseovarius pacificus]|uniref:hypothetical protein n=1 Tax=Roseovarius pacificus TaxID=337701 RepID=UPI002A18A70B|nr:hypothetical protein [Roseovarius pacificus]